MPAQIGQFSRVVAVRVPAELISAPVHSATSRVEPAHPTRALLTATNHRYRNDTRHYDDSRLALGVAVAVW